VTAVAHRCCQRARGVHRPVLRLATAALGSFELSSNALFAAPPMHAALDERDVGRTSRRCFACDSPPHRDRFHDRAAREPRSLDGHESCDSQRGSVLDTGAMHRSTSPSSPRRLREASLLAERFCLASPFRTAPSISAREKSARDAASRLVHRAISRRAPDPRRRVA
jgi:hypothetical protein